MKPQNLELSKEETNLIEEFEAIYNSIDHYLRTFLGKGKAEPFSLLISEYARGKKYWADTADYLRMIGDLRNCLIHEKTEPYQYLAVPAPMVVERLRTLLEELQHPVLVIPKFRRKVEKIFVDDSIADVLKRIAKHHYSQFPVYEDTCFSGLLTENGITRWLAHHVASELSLVELADVSVKDVLKEEEKRPNWMFISRGRTMQEAKELLMEKGLLEAILITETGKQTKNLLGIITRWDLLQMDG